MDNLKNDNYYIEMIREDLKIISEYMQGVDMEEFCNNELIQDASMFRLVQISENAKYLSEEYKEKHTEIPWSSLYGLRNRIVHDYGHIDLETVYNTLHSDIPELMEILQ